MVVAGRLGHSLSPTTLNIYSSHKLLSADTATSDSVSEIFMNKS